ncbi:MAG: alpha/beta hydrolase [Gemmatimonadales bacterium]
MLVASLCFVFSLVLAVAPGAAQEPRAREWTPPFSIEVLDLPRASNGIDYRLLVRRPLVAPDTGEAPVAVYLLDALWNLPAVAAIQSNLEFLDHFPPLLFVGIGYQNETTERLEANRTRDYTPTSFRPADPSKHFLKPVDYEGSGGADRFLEVVEREMVPLVERRYGARRDRRAIVGKSIGGLLATHALLARPSLFSDYLIISPALWWDDYFLDFRDRAVMRAERASHAARLPHPSRVYLTMGDAEERLGMLADVYVLARALRLRNDPGLGLTVKLMEGEDHEGSFAPGFARGLRALLER